MTERTGTITRVSTGSGLPHAVDILDYATALIRAYHWNGKAHEGVQSNEVNGFTLHDAVGEACRRLSTAVEPQGKGNQKDWVAQDQTGQTRNMRQEANRYLLPACQAKLDEGITGKKTAIKAASDAGTAADVILNDVAKDEQVILDALSDARDAAAKGGSE